MTKRVSIRSSNQDRPWFDERIDTRFVIARAQHREQEYITGAGLPGVSQLSQRADVGHRPSELDAENAEVQIGSIDGAHLENLVWAEPGGPRGLGLLLLLFGLLERRQPLALELAENLRRDILPALDIEGVGLRHQI